MSSDLDALCIVATRFLAAIRQLRHMCTAWMFVKHKIWRSVHIRSIKTILSYLKQSTFELELFGSLITIISVPPIFCKHGDSNHKIMEEGLSDIMKLTLNVFFPTAQIVILHNNEIFGACFIHVLSTNFCMWADVMVDKVSTTLHLDQNKDKHAGSSVSFYLLPALSEYCLLSAALIYEITVRIGQPSYIELEEDESDIEEEDEFSDEGISDDSGETETDEERRRKGSVGTTTGDREATDVSSSKSPTISDPELAIKRVRKKRRSPGRSLSRMFAKHVKKRSRWEGQADGIFHVQKPDVP
ncbi:hypothetical protein ACTXT7_008859 [Hymenolepis weldensis]